MKTKNYLLLSLLFVLLTSCAAPQNKEADNPEEEATAWLDLTNADLWRGYNMDTLPSNWKISEGEIECFGQAGDVGGDIITKAVYADFELSLEWKLTKGGNSGVMYHIIEDTIYHSPYQTGPEVQVLDDTGYDGPLEEWQLAGADYNMYVANESKKLNPAGEWNHFIIKFKDNQVEHWMNGTKIVEFEAWSDDWYDRKAKSKWANMPHWGVSGTGHIGLQDHGAGVWFRNVKIKKL